MKLVDIILLIIIILLFTAAITYIYKKKKQGVKCIGCPSGGNCCKCKKKDI